MAENENKNEEKKSPESPEQKKRNTREEGRRPPRAAIVWLVIMLLIGSLFLFKGFGSGQKADISQSQFEMMLRADLIETAVLVSEGDRVFTVEGFLRKPGSGKETKNAIPERYRTRVIFSNALNELLARTRVQVDSNNAGVWNFLLFALLPVVVIVGMIYFFSARQMRMNGQGAMEFGRSRARMIPPDELNVHFSDIAGADEAK